MAITLDTPQPLLESPEMPEIDATSIPQKFDPPDMTEAFGENPWDVDAREESARRDEMLSGALAKIDKAALDPAGYFSGKDMSLSLNPIVDQRMATVDAFLRLQNGGEPFDTSPNPLANDLTRATIRQRVAHSLFDGRGADDDDAFFTEIQKSAQNRIDRRALGTTLATKAHTAALISLTDPGKEAEFSWPAFREEARKAPGYTADDEASLYEAYHASRAESQAALASFAPELQNVWSAMKSGPAGNFSQVAQAVIGDMLGQNPDKPMGTGREELAKKDAPRLALDAYYQLTEDERPQFMHALATLARTLPKEEQAAFFTNLAKQGGRDIDDLTRNIGSIGLTNSSDEDFQRRKAAMESRAGENPVARFILGGEGGGIDAATYDPASEESMRGAQSKLLAARNFASDVRNIERQDYNPVKSAWGDEKMGILETGLYGVPGALASSVMVAVPYVGIPAMFSSMEGAAYDDIRGNLMASGMSDADATARASEWATVAALPQAALERLQAAALVGKLPFLDRFFTSLGNKVTSNATRFAIRTGVGTAQETLIETAQDFVPHIMQDLAATMSEEIPDVTWSNGKDGALDGFWTQQATTLVTMLPLAIIGAAGGISADQRVQAFQNASDNTLLALGASREQLAELRAAQAQGIETVRRTLPKILDTLDPSTDTAKQAVEELVKEELEKQGVAAEATASGILPRFTRTAEGWTLHDSETGAEIGTAPNAEAALRLAITHTDSIDEADANRLAYMATMLEAGDFTALTETLTRQTTTDFRPGETVTAAQQAAISPEDAARVAAQVELKEKLEGGTGEVSGVVFGQSTTTFENNQRRTVNRLNQGASVLTVFHEETHGFWREAIATGRLKRAHGVAVLKALDTILARKSTKEGQPVRFLPADFDTLSAAQQETAIDEAISELMEAEVLRTRKGTGVRKIPAGIISRNLAALTRIAGGEATNKFRAFARALRSYFGIAIDRAAHLDRALKDGTINQSLYNEFLTRLLGQEEQAALDQQARDYEAEITEGTATPEAIPEGDPFSIGRTTVTPTASTRTFQGQDGQTVIGPASFSIGAFHGTPHKVDKFTTAKIGTGEGAQAYGWGLYFADSEAVARNYRDNLAGNYKRTGGFANPWKNPRPFGSGWIVEKNDGGGNATFPSKKKALEFKAAKDLEIEKANDTAPLGNLYRVTLKVEEEDLLDWDKPLAEQSEKVREALAPYKFRPHYEGRTIHSEMAAREEFEGLAPSERYEPIARTLSQSGIRGIRYLDGNSRADGQGSYNYVIFNEADIEILEENGNPVQIGNSSFSLGPAALADAMRQDATYLAAVQAGDMETAQRMVDEAAQAAGYDVEAYHGTNNSFTVFDTNGRGKTEGSGAFFTSNPSNAASYGKNLLRVFLSADGPQINAQGANWNNLSVYEAYDKNGEPIGEFDTFADAQKAAGKKGNVIDFAITLSEDGYIERDYESDEAATSTDTLAALARQRGFDSITFTNIVDSRAKALDFGLSDKERAASQVIAVFNPNQIKSADPVTYDEAGNVIPLSQRFDSTKDSISYAMGSAALADAMRQGAIARIKDPQRRVRAMANVARKMEAIHLVKARLELIHGSKRAKASLRKEAAFREAALAEQYENEAYARHYGILDDADLLKIKSQPVHSFLSDPESPLRGTLMSKSRAIKDHPDLFRLHRAGDYDGSDGVSRSVFGGTRMPDQAAQDLFEANLIKEPTADALWQALLKEQAMVATMKDLHAAAKEDIRSARTRAKQETNEWLAAEVGKQEANFSPKQEVLDALALLDAILSSVSPEIRGKVGGYTQLAKLGTDESRLAFLTTRLERIDTLLEQELRTEFGREMEALLKRARPQKDAPGEKPKGTAGSDVHDLFREVERYMSLPIEEAEAEAVKLESLAASGTLTPEQESHNTLLANMLRLAGDWTKADAARRESAVTEATRIFAEGYLAHRIIISARSEARQRDREKLKANTGKSGVRSERRAQAKKKATKLGRTFESLLSLLSFEQITQLAFGKDSEIGNRLVDWERRASYARQDAVDAKTQAIEDLFVSLAGSALAGEKLRYEMGNTDSVTVTNSRGTHNFTQLEAISATLMWMQEDGRRHMEGFLDDAGNPIGEWGWTQADMDALESQLTDEAKAVRVHLQEQYGAEYDRLNTIYRDLNGINLPRNKFYSPLTVKPQNVQAGQVNDPVSGFAVSAGFSPGSLKTRSQTAVAEPDFRDALATYIGHTTQIEHYIAYAPFATEAMALINTREVGNSVEAAAGPETLSLLRKWLDHFSQGGNRDAAAYIGFTQGLNRKANRVAAAALVGRVSVLAIQSTQLGAALAQMPTGAYLSRFAKLTTGQLDWGAAIKSDYIQRRIRQMPPIVRQAMEGLQSAEPNAIKHVMAKIGETIAGADALFTAGTYAIIYDYQKSQGLTGQELIAATERSVERVAQPTRTGTRSFFEVSTSGNPSTRILWAFASETRQKLALVGFALAKGTAGEKARALAVAWIFGGVVASLIRATMRDIRDDEDDEIFDERNWSPKRLALMSLTGPLGGLPVAGDILESITFAAAGEYLPEGNLFSSVGGVLRLKNVPDWFTGDRDADEIIGDIDAILTALAPISDTNAAASSAFHIVKDAEAIIRNFLPD